MILPPSHCCLLHLRCQLFHKIPGQAEPGRAVTSDVKLDANPSHRAVRPEGVQGDLRPGHRCAEDQEEQEHHIEGLHHVLWRPC